MPTTSNFGWTTPADTDLVKDGAAAIRTLGNGIDTSLVDLKGGTTGQNLRKASNTDLDFTFAGDATNTVIDAEGDLLVGDSADTLQRLAIGTTGQVLTVDTTLDGKIKWAAASGGTNVKIHNVAVAATTTLSTSTLTDITGYSVTFTPTSATNNIIIFGQVSTDSTIGDVDRLAIDVGGTTYAIKDNEQANGNNNQGHMIYARLSNLAASSQTVKLRGRASGAALITYYGSTAGYVGSGITVMEIY